MRCPDCDYELRAGLLECPRCEYRRNAPPPVPEVAPAPAAVPEEFTHIAAVPEARPRVTPTRWAGALLAVVLLVGAGAGLARRAQTPEAQVRAIFAASEAPCRHGEAGFCQDSVKKIRALDDQPDASLLLADLKVADYLHTQPDGDRLSARWQQDQITQAELTKMGNDAAQKGLKVYRSLWINAEIKRDGVSVPELIFGGADMPAPMNGAYAQNAPR